MKKSKRKRTPAHTNALQALEVSESKWLPVTLCPVKAKDGGGAARRGVRTAPRWEAWSPHSSPPTLTPGQDLRRCSWGPCPRHIAHWGPAVPPLPCPAGQLHPHPGPPDSLLLPELPRVPQPPLSPWLNLFSLPVCPSVPVCLPSSSSFWGAEASGSDSHTLTAGLDAGGGPGVS